MVDVRIVNPFVISTISVLKQVAMLEGKRGALGVKEGPFPSHDIAVKVTVVGDISGGVTYSFDSEFACIIASKMMGGNSLENLNEMAQSALKELGNMISGRACTQISSQGIASDITPPEICLDKKLFKIKSDGKEKAIVIPLEFPEGMFEINVAIRIKDKN